MLDVLHPYKASKDGSAVHKLNETDNTGWPPWLVFLGAVAYVSRP